MKFKLKQLDIWQRISLRTKLTAISVALIGLLLVVSSFGTMSLLRTYLQQNVDTLLTSTASTLSHEDPTLLEARLATKQLTLPRLPSDYYIAYLDTEGNLLIGLVSSTNNNQKVPNVSKFTAGYVASTAGIPFEVDSPASYGNDDLTWRMVAVPLINMPGSLVIALPVDANAALIRQYASIGLGFGILLIAFSAISIWLTITSALRPLREVERTAALVAEGDTSKRLVEGNRKTEIGRLNRALNTMLNSIDNAMTSRNKTLDQMRRFVADASHELRTPLVSVRGYAELYRMGALKSKDEIGEAMARIESEAIRMGDLVESLLTLARLDEATELKTSPTDLINLAEVAAKDASVADNNRVIKLTDLEGKPLGKKAKLIVEVDAPGIRQVLTNLLANASRFSKPQGEVEIAIAQVADQIVIEVADHGEGIPAQLRDKVFERFYRADNSRNRETGGSGLGLSIVKQIVNRHGGSISIRETEGGGATFTVTLPKK